MTATSAIEPLDADYRPFEHGHLPCRDGRWLEHAVYGDPDGVPLVAFHGSPGTRAEAAIYGPAARVLGVRVLALSRPGFGRSTPHPRRRIADFVDDVEAVLDLRGAERVRVVGYSAGGAYAMAAAVRLGDRVDGLGMIAPVAPLSITRALPGIGVPLHLSGASTMTLARRIPALRRGIDAMTRRSRDFRGLPDASADAFLHSLAGALTRGPWPTIADLGLVMLRDWGFDPAAITCERVEVWQGRRDWQVPWIGTARLTERIPGARLHLDGTANHHSVMTRHVDELMIALAAPAPGGGASAAR